MIGPTGQALAQALAQAIAIFQAGWNWLNVITSANFQVKTGAGVFAGFSVNTGGSTSAVKLYDGTSSVVTMTIAVPGVVSWAAHPFVAGDAVKFTTTGALPTGLTANTLVYVSSAGLTADTFRVADTAAHAIAGTNSITTSGSQSGVHTGWDVSHPMGSFPTTAAQPFPPGAGPQFADGLIAYTTDGGGAADITILYR
jgi:hypothetical protein